MSQTNQSRFVWYDLMSPDRAASRDFYAKVVGWKSEPFGGPDSAYDMFVADSGPVGGVTELGEALEKMGVPPHWMGYVCVEDVDASSARAKELGATIMKEAFDVPTVGRIAIMVDPQGAGLGLFTPEHPGGPLGDEQSPGEVSWHELMSNDHLAALDFYNALFGWEKTDSMDSGEGGSYQMFKAPGMGVSLGGAMNKPDMMPKPAWQYYVKVRELDPALAAVADAGGKVVNGPMEVPGGDRVAQCLDPQGAAFALVGN
jgi:predicted enzyme related to lactoylglutathione lyase